jgi:putative transposase
MVTKRRHSEPEISAKLAIAREMVGQGRLHRDIAKSLGVSLMTYHRWRKAHGTFVRPTGGLAGDAQRMDIPIEREQMSQIRDLQLENSRLRRLVTDLLLEKVNLQEALGSSALDRRTGRA